MYVIGHKAVGPDLGSSLARCLAEKVAVQREIIVLEECLLAAVAALRDVIGDAWNDDAARRAMLPPDRAVPSLASDFREAIGSKRCI